MINLRESPTRAPRPSIAERFAAFHAANPHVVDEMLAIARRRLDAGERVSIKRIAEEMRDSAIVEKTSRWKLDNSIVSHIADELIRREPRLAAVIETRRRRAT